MNARLLSSSALARLLAALASLASLGACGGEGASEPRTPVTKAPKPPATCTLLSINDTYRIDPLPDGQGGLSRVRTLRARVEEKYGPTLLLHAGDFLYPSILSRTYHGAQMIDVLNHLDGSPTGFDERMFVTFGNHEFDGREAQGAVDLGARIASSQFLWLGTNIVFTADASSEPIRASRNLKSESIIDCGGVKVGLFSLTTDEKKPVYVERFLEPLRIAESKTQALRAAGAALVVALTHEAMGQDIALLEALRERGPDIIIGGHEHNHQSREIDGRGVYKADADAKSAYRITLQRAPGGRWTTDAELLPLGEDTPGDPQITALVTAKLKEHDALFCGKLHLPAGCLSEVIGATRTKLLGEELQIRRFETNLGNWTADVARAAFPKADIALLNAGALRLNHDIPPGPIRRINVEELFGFDLPLVTIEIDGETLKKVVQRAIQDWTGNGHWLQVSGFAYAHDPSAGTATRLTLLTPGGPRAIKEKDRLLAVVPLFLVSPREGQDGYTMLKAGKDETGPALKPLVYAALAAAGGAGIAPSVEGRICNTEVPGPCLALPE